MVKERLISSRIGCTQNGRENCPRVKGLVRRNSAAHPYFLLRKRLVLNQLSLQGLNGENQCVCLLRRGIINCAKTRVVLSWASSKKLPVPTASKQCEVQDRLNRSLFRREHQPRKQPVRKKMRSEKRHTALNISKLDLFGSMWRGHETPEHSTLTLSSTQRVVNLKKFQHRKNINNQENTNRGESG
jgi:hypothetical protein